MNSYLIEKLKEGRLNKGLKQSDVTRLIGIKNTTLSNYEMELPSLIWIRF